uniref:Uncharacterized protein n=1 Tax=Rhizophora mucronata TaxID=61149 RepID=A0A2P2Q2D2_RHIMU
MLVVKELLSSHKFAFSLLLSSHTLVSILQKFAFCCKNGK